MKKILIVEDSKLFSKLLARRIVSDFQTECVICTTYKETVALLENDPEQFLLAVLDLNLPDSADGEVVDFVLAKGIPVVVVTARMDAKIREEVLDKQVLDYIMKGPHTLDQLTETTKRYLRNQDITLLLVDDSDLFRQSTRKLLETQHYEVLEAENGTAALEIIKQNSNISLVITDYHMPEMDGFELTAEIRKIRTMDKLAIIGMSAYGNPLLSSQFLKRGANDFLTKPYFEEELICRVNQNIEIIEHIAQLRDAAIKDQLTRLYNRRYFFGTGEKLFENARRQNLDIAIAMIDIDHFKNVNDTYGHGDGDATLLAVAAVLEESFRASDIVTRFGGEEFIIMAVNMSADHRANHFETVRRKIEELTTETSQNKIKVTVSIGVATALQDSLDEMVKKADALLYQAKESGRNRVIIEN
ncbi:MAG: diguanylate cyclase [Desulfuromusa sp.]|nr:diguanylate cyclase [Desulfuromusa sp.]